jgi:hypothetical protein
MGLQVFAHYPFAAALAVILSFLARFISDGFLLPLLRGLCILWERNLEWRLALSSLGIFLYSFPEFHSICPYYNSPFLLNFLSKKLLLSK